MVTNLSADSMNPAMPLEGITVVELGTSVAAPYATLALAEMGALVLKIEHPKGGDPARSWGRPITDGQTLVFAACNRDKKSIALDLSDADSRRRLRELIRGRADVVVQNLRPGMASELELDAEHLRAEKPELIYCNIGAFGASGPLSRWSFGDFGNAMRLGLTPDGRTLSPEYMPWTHYAGMTESELKAIWQYLKTR